MHAVVIANTGKTVAFQVHLRVLKGRSGDDILPIFFSDNYIELAPGESRTIFCSFANKDTKGAVPFFVTSAWNLDLMKCKAANGSVRFEDPR
jgi:exo-1,4-beta-D-glucosaminidase